MNRDDFMEFFRDTEKLNTLSVDDRIEIWETILPGSSDITPERLYNLISDYSAGRNGQLSKELCEMDGYFGLWWSIDDIIDRAKKNWGVVLDRDEAMQIAENIQFNGDCEYGITWASIEYGIEEYLDFKSTLLI